MQDIYGKVLEIDLDGTLCSIESNYSLATPFVQRIKVINSLYEAGNIININTGRGSTTGINWEEITKKQLEKWGVKYHSLKVGKKPYYDYIVDDKALDINALFNSCSA